MKIVGMVSVCLAFWCSLAAAAPSGTETAVHGAGDVYGGAGATIAWAVLRGATEPATLVVLRVSADPAVYTAVEVVGRNPFSQSERIHLPPTPIAGRVDVRIPRSSFADFPRTELRFAARPGLTPLVVYYLSVPDTTPEFANQAALEAYLGDRIERTRAGKSP